MVKSSGKIHYDPLDEIRWEYEAIQEKCKKMDPYTQYDGKFKLARVNDLKLLFNFSNILKAVHQIKRYEIRSENDLPKIISIMQYYSKIAEGIYGEFVERLSDNRPRYNILFAGSEEDYTLADMLNEITSLEFDLCGCFGDV